MVRGPSRDRAIEWQWMSPMTQRPLQKATEKPCKGEGAGEELSLHRKVPSNRAKPAKSKK